MVIRCGRLIDYWSLLSEIETSQSDDRSLSSPVSRCPRKLFLLDLGLLRLFLSFAAKLCLGRRSHLLSRGLRKRADLEGREKSGYLLRLRLRNEGLDVDVLLDPHFNG